MIAKLVKSETDKSDVDILCDGLATVIERPWLMTSEKITRMAEILIHLRSVDTFNTAVERLNNEKPVDWQINIRRKIKIDSRTGDTVDVIIYSKPFIHAPRFDIYDIEIDELLKAIEPALDIMRRERGKYNVE